MLQPDSNAPSRPSGAQIRQDGNVRRRIVIVGAGFGGLEAARRLAGLAVDVIVIDRNNHHLFQPLLYQVATAELSPADIAWPIRWILRGQDNATVMMAEVKAVDVGRRRIETTAGPVDYDFLILATGATHAYFGHEDWAPAAPGLKRVEDATGIRRRLLSAFERAELASDPQSRKALLTFVVVGGGPTGVEMAGAIAELARRSLARDFRHSDPASARIMLVEAGPRVLGNFPAELSAVAGRELARLGVELRLDARVTRCDAAGVEIGSERIAAATIVWAAGVAASPAARWLGAEHDRAGRVIVAADLSVPGAPEIFAIGDTAVVAWQHGTPIPGIAPAAKQMGADVARRIVARLECRAEPGPFRYRHQGDLATIGRGAAIVALRRLRLTGFAGWIFWSIAHVYFLVGLKNRLAVAIDWLWSYLTSQRGARLITGSDC
jgi:NADH dehydrogenase